MKKYRETENQLQQLAPGRNGQKELERLAYFLSNVANAWREANQENSNKLAGVLFEEIRLDRGEKVVAVKPRPELVPFFKLSLECHDRDTGGDPGGIRDLMQYLDYGFYPVTAALALIIPHIWHGKISGDAWPELGKQHKIKSLRRLANEYGVSHETIRRTLAAESHEA